MHRTEESHEHGEMKGEMMVRLDLRSFVEIFDTEQVRSQQLVRASEGVDEDEGLEEGTTLLCPKFALLMISQGYVSSGALRMLGHTVGTKNVYC